MSTASDLSGWLSGTFEGGIGTVYDSREAGAVAGHFELRSELLTPSGEAPLGLYATVAEGAASLGAAMDVLDQRMVVAGMSNDTTVTERIVQGRVSFRSECQHRAPDLSIWNTAFRDADGAVVAVSTVRVAVRSRREGT
jgi:hypothetical protein